MPKPHTRNEKVDVRLDMMASALDDRNDTLIDALVTAAALVARADGHVDPIERASLSEFAAREGLLGFISRDDLLAAFDRRMAELDGIYGPEIAVDILNRLQGMSVGRLVVDAGEHVAAADDYVHPREDQVLRLVRAALSRTRQEASAA